MHNKTAPFVLALLVSTLPAQAQDFLGGDDFAFDSSAIEVSESHWTDGFKTTLEHSHTQVPGDPNRQQSSARLEYEGNLAEGWYLKLDTRYRYFYADDDLAENRGGAYGKNKWQRAWLQYSRGSCTATAGRQTLIWGTVEGTFVTDIVTPFDYTEQLLTDFGNVRLAQDMLVGDCFVGSHQFQVFYTPDARTDIFQHHRLTFQLAPGFPEEDLSVDAEEEWGFRYKVTGSGFDLSLMAARLFDNTPTVVVDLPSSPNDPLSTLLAPFLAGIAPRPDIPVESKLARFNLLGMASSVAIGRLLFKFEAAHRDRQLIQISGEETERYDAALGFEYTTSGNHMFNGGIWGTHFKNDNVDTRDTQVLTLGWRKTYLNDNLIMSLLGNWSSEPRFGALTVLAEYQWNDYWNTALALSVADLDELEMDIPIIPAEEAATVSIKYEF